MPYPYAWSVYAEQLVGRGYGLPLWHPEPTRYGEVEIGDVGYVSEGQFIRLFNAMRPKGHPLNIRGVPEDFVMLEANEENLFSKPQHVSQGPICTATTTYRKVSVGASDSGNLAGASYTFNCHSSRGAIAVLGDFGHQKWYDSNSDFWDYIVKHHASWHKFAAGKGLLVPAEAIILVSGWLKTTEWAVAAVSNYGKAHDFSFTASAGSYAAASFEVSAGTDVQMSVEQRAGPILEDSDQSATSDSPVQRPKPPCDQCLFLRYYKLKPRTLGLGRGVDVTADAKDVIGPGDEHSPSSRRQPPHTGGSSSQGSSSRLWGLLSASQGSQRSTAASSGWDDKEVEVEEEPSTTSRISIPDPLDDLLGLVLERYPSANAAVLSHDDFYSIFPPKSYPKGVSKAALKERLSQGLDVRCNADNVASMSKNYGLHTTLQEGYSRKERASATTMVYKRVHFSGYASSDDGDDDESADDDSDQEFLEADASEQLWQTEPVHRSPTTSGSGGKLASTDAFRRSPRPPIPTIATNEQWTSIPASVPTTAESSTEPLKIHFTERAKRQLEELERIDPRYRGKAREMHEQAIKDYAKVHKVYAKRARVRKVAHVGGRLEVEHQTVSFKRRRGEDESIAHIAMPPRTESNTE